MHKDNCLRGAIWRSLLYASPQNWFLRARVDWVVDKIIALFPELHARVDWVVDKIIALFPELHNVNFLTQITIGVQNLPQKRVNHD